MTDEEALRSAEIARSKKVAIIGDGYQIELPLLSSSCLEC